MGIMHLTNSTRLIGLSWMNKIPDNARKPKSSRRDHDSGLMTWQFHPQQLRGHTFDRGYTSSKAFLQSKGSLRGL
jgi:hypothetical protein